MNEFIRCCICRNEYEVGGKRIPLMLPCSHTFCKGCITEHVDLASSYGRKWIGCAKCGKRQSIPEGNNFPVNRYILPFFRKKHEDVCQVHKKVAILFCKDTECQKGICASCVVGDEHRTHDIVEMKDEKEKLLAEINSNIEIIVKDREIKKSKLYKEKRQVSARNELCVAKLEKGREKILNNIKAKFDEKIEIVTKFENTFNLRIKGEEADLEKDLEMVGRSKSVVNTSQTHESLSETLLSMQLKRFGVNLTEDVSKYYVFDGEEAEEKAEKLCLQVDLQIKEMEKEISETNVPSNQKDGELRQEYQSAMHKRKMNQTLSTQKGIER